MTSGARGISPVVGVALLIIIVTLLGAVSATMVFDLSEEREPAPEVALEMEVENASAGEYVLRHDSGETLDGDKVEILGLEDPDTIDEMRFVAGDERTVVPTDETVTVIYHGEHGTIYTLREFSVDPSLGSSDDGLSLPSADEGCSWVDTESDGGTEDVKVEDGLVVDCDVTTEKIVEVFDGGAVTGDTESEGNAIDVDDGTLYGDATAEKVVNVQDGAVHGTVVSTTADVKIDDSYVNESIQGAKVVEVINGGTVEGDAVSTNKEVKVNSGSTVEGDVTSGDSVKLTDATVEGDVYIDEGDFDCTDSTIDGESCSEYDPKDPDDY
ncbi:type IV pilin N-terminal domain-containing protein [Halapricum desulfuricans]|uniref:Pilin/Flagellin, FlaG/FlaF family n=1 Tax=Halapricum desulfuricans TaxID=2841257 RepID=A0A897NCE2_9EURY|nr:type IV pilin N-terminal domain-containing protein [Halapricum desulfuricans]QSG10138.1 Pilin/Flagellin, FlaG/FlaF family [Halapricum desulfuricans]